MKKIGALTALAVTLLMTGSCMKDSDFLITNDQTMGDIVGGRFLSDQGIWYDIVEQTCKGRLADCKRALVVSDILKNTSTKDELSYEIRLKNFVEVGLPEIVIDPEAQQQDPVLVDLAWISGGYLNLRLVYHVLPKSSVKHTIRVAVKQTPTISDPLIVQVFHDAGGVYLGAEGIADDELEAQASFVSVPISTYYTASANEICSYYVVEFLWHKTAEDGKTLLPETEMTELKGNLYR